MVRVCFITRALTAGGSERQLVELVSRLDPSEFQVSVLVFYPGGSLWETLARHPGIDLVALDKRGRWDVAGFLWRAWREVRTRRPHIVHGYLGVANELALALGRLSGARVAWRLGAAWMDFSQYDWLWAATFRVGALLSRWPDAIVVNSRASLEHHRASGWATRRMVLVPNGFDVSTFARDPAAGASLRAEWGIPPDATVVGLVARLDPIKDHETFLRAAAILSTSRQEVRFVCVGEGSSDYAQRLRGLTASLRLDDRVLWAGGRADVRRAYNAFDVATLCSRGESLPNVLGEAMACEVPCVATAVGDVERLVGDTGIVVPPGRPDALAGGWHTLLSMPPHERRDLGARARARIVSDFSLAACVERTADLLRRLGRGDTLGSSAAAAS